MSLYDIEFLRSKSDAIIDFSNNEVNKTFLSNLKYIKTVNKAQLEWFIKHRKMVSNILGFIDSVYFDE